MPGLGPRSARRAALHLIRKREPLLGPLAEAMRVAYEKIVTCSVCGNVDARDPCTICGDERRDGAILVVVESVGDLWALERANATRARYHVLGGALSPLDGVGPDDLNLSSLVARVAEGGVKEVVLAVNATVDGQTTAHYVDAVGQSLVHKFAGGNPIAYQRRHGRALLQQVFRQPSAHQSRGASDKDSTVTPKAVLHYSCQTFHGACFALHNWFKYSYSRYVSIA